MIIYSSTKNGFIDDFEQGVLIDKLYESLANHLKKTGKSEITSWQNSLSYMCNVIRDKKIPNKAGIAIEYVVPNTNKRVDFIITGRDENELGQVVIIELKQWNEASIVRDKENIVKTFVGGGYREVTHPSYQAWSYAFLLENYNSNVQDKAIVLHPCAYLHNFHEGISNDLRDKIYEDILSRSPLFTQGQMKDLRGYIHRYIKEADKTNVLGAIESGRLRPSKSLQDSIDSMLKGNVEFVMIDDQKVQYETILKAIRDALRYKRKMIYIIRGGPGTGKSVVAINLLVSLIKTGVMAQYITKNQAPRDVYKLLLTEGKKRTKSSVDGLFKGADSFLHYDKASLQVAIVDEAHRLRITPNQYKTSLNQIKEIIDASQCTVFFIDEYQRVTKEDAGTIAQIRSYVDKETTDIYEGALESQFRCNGSDGYLAWLDHTLEVRETANFDGFEGEYEFKVFDSPQDMYDAIVDKNRINHKSRLLAGYCWDWKSKRDKSVQDIDLPNFNFRIAWNDTSSKKPYAIDDNSINFAGSIHTTQGLEFDYVGVIIGDDMRYEDGHIVTDVTKRAKTDRSVNGIKGKIKDKSLEVRQLAEKEAAEIIKNTYRTLMTRGMKGCYVFCTDKKLRDYLRRASNKINNFIDN